MTYILGVRYSILALILYVIGGLFVWPYFALSTKIGIGYIKNPVFSYILAYFPTVFAVGFSLKKFKGFLRYPLTSFFGVLTLNIAGFFISLIYILFKLTDFSHVYYFAVTLGLTKFFYDFVFSIFALMVAKPIKQILWVAMRNDIIRDKNKK